MTQVVGSAVGDTPDELYASARRAAESDVDWIEIRLDTPTGLPWDLRSFFSFGKPCLATVRHTVDGGRSDADDRARGEILRRALLAGARGIDVEAWHDDVRSLVSEAREHGAFVVVSRHQLDGTPAVDEIVRILREGWMMGADVSKLATRVEGPLDAASLVEAAHRARAAGIPYALMAVNDPFLRLLAPQLRMRLAYASVPGSPAAAAGQVPVADLRRAWSRPSVMPGLSGATRAVFLLGHPVAHSKSPRMQNAAFAEAGIDAHYLALDVAPEALSSTLAGLKATNAMGCNLTIPHKELAVTMMDELDESAKAASAVNTVVFREGRAIGHNTDGAGALDALREAGVKLRDARVLVIGVGGTGGAIVHALRREVKELVVTNRTAARTLSLDAPSVPWERIDDVLKSVDVLVNATSVGLRGEKLPVSLGRMMPGSAVLDCVYGEGDTPLIRDARGRGLLAVPGESMLLHQGARAFTLWTGEAAPVDEMRAELRSMGAAR